MTDRAMESLAPRPAGRAAIGDVGAMVVVVIAILVTMHVVSGFVPDYIMPSPAAVARSAATPV